MKPIKVNGVVVHCSDCINHMLKALDKPVAVYFEDIAINTLTQTGELLMVVMAAIAQGESEAKSESVKWGFQKRFEKGLPKFEVSKRMRCAQ